MKPTLMFLAVLAALAGCAGTIPAQDQGPEDGQSALLIGCRIVLPTGQTRSGSLALNFESERSGSYRIELSPEAPGIFQVEPETYKIAPTKSVFGAYQKELSIEIEGRRYRVPFPREMLRAPAIVVKPSRIVSIGLVEVQLRDRLPGREPEVRVSLDDSIDTRRTLVQNVVRAQMDPKAPAAERANAVRWTRALERTLSELLTEAQRSPAFRAVP